MATKKRKSRIRGEMRETALGLHDAGVISKRRMNEFEAVLNTSVSTVQKWETGDKKPSRPSLKLLNLIERKGLEALI